MQYYGLLVPANAVSATVRVVANNNSPNPFPGLPVYVSQYNFPDPANASTYDFVKTNQVLIPPDSGGTIAGLDNHPGDGLQLRGGQPVCTGGQLQRVHARWPRTNDLGNYYSVLEGMNDGLGGFYRYESGTSMAAADVSGTLALIQDFFTNHCSWCPARRCSRR